MKKLKKNGQGNNFAWLKDLRVKGREFIGAENGLPFFSLSFRTKGVENHALTLFQHLQKVISQETIIRSNYIAERL
jgi:hypothetical protein